MILIFVMITTFDSYLRSDNFMVSLWSKQYKDEANDTEFRFQIDVRLAPLEPNHKGS